MRVPLRRVDRLLQRLAADQVAQQEEQLPLVLLVAAGRAAGQHRLAVAVAPASGSASSAAAGPGPARTAAPPPARTSAAGCRGRSPARGWSASSAASHRSGWPRPCCPTGRRRRRGRCRRGSPRPAPRSARPGRSGPPERRPAGPGPARTPGSRGCAPVGRPGRSSREARLADQRRALRGVRRGEQGGQRRRRRRRRTRPPVGERELAAPRPTAWMPSAVDGSSAAGRRGRRAAQLCSSTGPWPQACGLGDRPEPCHSCGAGSSQVAEKAARSSPVTRPACGLAAGVAERPPARRRRPPRPRSPRARPAGRRRSARPGRRRRPRASASRRCKCGRRAGLVNSAPGGGRPAARQPDARPRWSSRSSNSSRTPADRGAHALEQRVPAAA